MRTIIYDNLAFPNKKQLFWYLNSKPFKTKEDIEYARKIKKTIKFSSEDLWKIMI